jgi:hypothetical protein
MGIKTLALYASKKHKQQQHFSLSTIGTPHPTRGKRGGGGITHNNVPRNNFL